MIAKYIAGRADRILGNATAKLDVSNSVFKCGQNEVHKGSPADARGRDFNLGGRRSRIKHNRRSSPGSPHFWRRGGCEAKVRDTQPASLLFTRISGPGTGPAASFDGPTGQR